MFGNTHTVAERIADGLRDALSPTDEVVVVPVAEADDALVGSAALLVVGGPTHVHGLSRESTRHDAVEHPEKFGDDIEVDPDAEGPGLRDWFDALGTADHAVAAAFDTRVGTLGVMVTGRASKGIHKRLHRHGFAEVLPAESFLVDKETHLMEGEEQRAVDWGRQLAKALERG